MGENEGKGTKGRNYDELSGVGTSSAGVTGTTSNLNNGVRDGQQSGDQHGRSQGSSLGKSLDQDVLGKEN